MKYKQLVKITDSTNSDLYALLANQLTKYQTYGMYTETVLNGSTDWDEQIQYTTPRGSSSTFDTIDFSPQGVPNDNILNVSNMIRSYGDQIVVVVSFVTYREVTGPPAEYTADIQMQWTTNGGSSWNSGNLVFDQTLTTSAEADATYKLADIFRIGSDYFCTIADESNQYSFYKGGSFLNKVTDLNARAAYYLGDLNAAKDKYYFIYEDTSNDLRLKYHDGTSITAVETLSISPPAGYGFNQQRYYRTGYCEWFVDNYQYQFREISRTAWGSLTASNTGVNGPVYDLDDDNDPIIVGLGWGDAYFVIATNGYPFKLQSGLTEDLRVGVIDWISNGSNGIWEVDFSNFPIVGGRYRNQSFLTDGDYALREGQLITTSAPIANQLLYLYLDDETHLVGIFNVITGGSIGSSFHKWILHSPLRKDLDKRFDDSFTTTDAPDILTNAVDDNMSLIFTDDGISTTPTTTYTQAWKNADLNQIRQFVDLMETYRSKIKPDFEIEYDDWTPVTWDHKLKGYTTAKDGIVQLTSGWNEDYDYKLTESGAKTGVEQWGTSASPSLGFTDNSAANCTATIISSLDGHTNVLQLYDNNGSANADVIKSITSFSSGSIELFATASSMAAGDEWYISFADGATRISIIRFYNDAGTFRIQYYDGVYNNITTFVESTFSHLKITFDCTTDTLDISVNGTELVTGGNFENVADAVDTLRIFGNNSDLDYYFYIDGIGYSADSYTAGSNRWRYLDGFIDYNAYNTLVSYETTVGNHSNVLKLYDNNTNARNTLLYTFSNQTTGSVGFFIRSTDASFVNNININDGFENQGIRFYLYQDKFQYYDDSFHDILTSVADDTWYYCLIIFNTTSTWTVAINGTTYGPYPYDGTPTAMDRIVCYTSTGSSGYSMYLDALAFSWAGAESGASAMLTAQLGLKRLSLLENLTNQTPYIQLYGKYENGVQANSVVQGNPNLQPLTATFPNLGQTNLDTLASAIETQRNQTIKRFRLRYGSRYTMATPGTAVTVSYLPESIIGKTWYIQNVRYNLYTLMNDITITSTKFIPILQNTTKQLNNQIASTEEKVENQTFGLNTIAADDVTPDVSAGSIFKTSANTGATAITDLDNPNVGSVIILLGGSDTNSSTIADGGNFKLNGNMTLGAGDSIMLYINADNDYWELSRTTV